MQGVQAPVQVKKNKKKTKTDVKPVQIVTTIEAKEPDDGETIKGNFTTSHFQTVKLFLPSGFHIPSLCNLLTSSVGLCLTF